MKCEACAFLSIYYTSIALTLTLAYVKIHSTKVVCAARYQLPILCLQEPAVIVTVLCDLGVKYLTKVYNEDWLHENHVEISSPDSA